MKRSHVVIAPPGWGAALGEELARVFPEAGRERRSADCWSVDAVPRQTEVPAIAFALQTLLNVAELDSTSIRRDADAVAVSLRELAGPAVGPWRLHVFSAAGDPKVTRGKAKLLSIAIRESLKRKAKGLLSALQDGDRPADVDVGLAQTTWLSSGRIAVSWCDRDLRAAWRRAMSPWPGGVAPIAADRRPPSRAYRKLLEALAQMQRGFATGETVVDLGASPGGWSFVALECGALVTAVDRSPLRADLTRRGGLQFVTGDAFRYRPERPVDWMIADVAAYPERTLELVDRWLASGWCTSLVATVKFVGEGRYAILDDFKAMLARAAEDFRVRKLLENKNEATIMAWRNSPASKVARNPGTASEG